jgi:hypothetical protein
MMTAESMHARCGLALVALSLAHGEERAYR